MQAFPTACRKRGVWQADRDLVPDAMKADSLQLSESETAEPPHMQMQSTIDMDPVIYLAIELSASTWLTGLHRIEAGNSRVLLALIADLRKKVAVKLGVEAAVVSCFEAGRDGFWLH